MVPIPGLPAAALEPSILAGDPAGSTRSSTGSSGRTATRAETAGDLLSRLLAARDEEGAAA